MTNSINFRIKGHSKSTFIEKGGGGGVLKANKSEQGEEVLTFVYVCFFKKNVNIFQNEVL